MEGYYIEARERLVCVSFVLLLHRCKLGKSLKKTTFSLLLFGCSVYCEIEILRQLYFVKTLTQTNRANKVNKAYIQGIDTTRYPTPGMNRAPERAKVD